MRAYNETLYDKDMIIRYNRFYLADFFKKNFSIIAVGAIVAAVYSLAVEQWETTLLILGMIVIYAVLTVVIQKTTQNRALKRSPIVQHPIIRSYLFDDDGITIEGRFVHPGSPVQGDTGPKKRTLTYQQVVRIVSRPQFMMIYDIERRTYLVDTNGFEAPEQLAELRTFLTVKFGKRFK